MHNFQQIIEQAERHCSENGQRLTQKRKQVLMGLVQSQKAMSAYELVDYCKTEFSEVLPAMSVYRILDFLQQQQLVHKLDLANKFIACAHISCKHEHAISQFLICGECQKVKEINIDKKVLKEIQNNVAIAGFSLVSPQFEMNCLCDECAKKIEKE